MSRYYEGWRPYVPVAARRAQALREMEKLRKRGMDIQPVAIEGRTIARSFWGKGWCSHLESFGDYSNRLPRGRTYVRNGSVCHLAVAAGTVEAIVSGSEFYNVSVDIDTLPDAKWKTLKQQCTGRIGSLLELLQGRLSEEIMGIVTDRAKGLFPRPGEIRYECDCPDWAGMCKHIAAVMYGIGARLDNQPDLLFLLRGVDHEELIAADAAAGAITGGGSQRRRRSLATTDLEGVFGVELEAEGEEVPGGADVEIPPKSKSAKRKTAKKKAARAKKRGPRKKAAQRKVAKKTLVAKAKQRTPREKAGSSRAKQTGQTTSSFKPTARSVAALRKKLGLNRSEFARTVGVSGATIKNWEEAAGALKPNAKSLAKLELLHDSLWK